jgi:branched-chain amino acid transport system ATP-binding protein
MILIEELTAGYGRLQVIFGISINFETAKINVIVGPNGSGKSTLLRSIFGLTKLYGGKILLDGDNITGLRPHEIARKGIAYLPQNDSVFANLKVSENLRMAAYTMHRDNAAKRIDGVKEIFPVIKNRWDARAQSLSGGERQMVAMAMALVRKPKVMLFDEPTSNLSPLIAKKILDQIMKLSRELGLTIIIVEQNARLALEMGDKACLLVSGKVIFEGHCNELLQQQELGRLYLGVRSDTTIRQN